MSAWPRMVKSRLKYKKDNRGSGVYVFNSRGQKS